MAMERTRPGGITYPYLQALPGQHGRDREQALPVRAHALVVVDELERAFAQLPDRDVRRRADAYA
jgi:hypothetical protein